MPALLTRMLAPFVVVAALLLAFLYMGYTVQDS
jgi:hypothetical protein